MTRIIGIIDRMQSDGNPAPMLMWVKLETTYIAIDPTAGVHETY
jgi:hypothetical protein